MLTQSLALHKLVSGRHTLTYIHDAMSAWAGIGSAIIGLWRQYSSISTLLGIVHITAYLACISALHVTTPSLFSLVPFNKMGGGVVQVIPALPIFNLS